MSYLLKVMLDFLDKEAELAPVVDPSTVDVGGVLMSGHDQKNP